MMAAPRQVTTTSTGNFPQQMMTPSGQIIVTSIGNFPQQMMTPSGQTIATSIGNIPQQMMTPSGQIITLAPGNILQQMMTPSGQVTATSTGCFPQKIISVSGKSANIANQSDLMPIHADQALMQYGIVANQQTVSSPKAVTSSQKEKMHMFQNQLIPLQPNTVYVSTMPVQSSTQRFNGNNVSEILSQPQVMTTQASGTMLNQAQLLGIQAISPLPPDLPWTHFQPNQNPFIIYNQQAGMAAQQFQPQMAMHLPVGTAMLPFTPTPATVATQKQILHKSIPIKKNVIRNILPSPSPSNLSSATVSSQMNRVPSIPVPQQMTTNNHIYHNPVQFYHDKTKSTGIENKAVSKISTTQKSQATVAPFPQILQTTNSSTSTIITAVPVTYSILPFGSFTVASSSTNTQTAVTYAQMNQAISIPIKQRSNASSQTYQIPVQGINYQTTNGIESKSVSIETKISLPQESQTTGAPFSQILQTSNSRTSLMASVASSTLNIESSADASTSPSNIQTVAAHTQINQVSSTSVAQEKSKAKDQICPNLVQIVNDKIKSEIESKSVCVETPRKLQTMIAPFANTLQACVISTIDAVSVASSASTTASSTMSVMVGSSVQMDTSFSTIDTTTSSISTIPPVPCLTNKEVSDFNLQSLSKSHNEAIGISHQIKTVQSGMTTEHVKSRQAVQEPSLKQAKQPQKAIVKPRMLTHVINGIVIQEGLEPFPVSKPPLLDLPYNTLLPAKKLESPKEKEDSPIGFNIDNCVHLEKLNV
ncbi:Polyhomeotic-like protein 2 like protein [Argiope bruennichi]|uniref:Polyhomeotic-like protein 2 like protein n=1 Tax=Argiope bruennichi TaxID=94029 RepID=A0A8T0F806_ARGBR|nr:Polyhomeotic-like protein 2 like protein [Argiope bruennichi]